MFRNGILISCITLTSLLSSGCAFFNTFYHARKAYNNGIDIIKRNKEQIQPQLNSDDIPADRFSQELKAIPPDAKQFFDVAIEKANKVVVLYPESGWAEEATLLLGKAHYLRDYTNDLYDAKNRLEVFMVRYPESKKIQEARLWYGKTLLKLNQIDDAENQFRIVADSDEKTKIKSEALILLGDIAIADEDYSAASGYYSEASDIAEDKSVKKAALYKTFYAYFHVRNFKLAIGYLNVISRMDLDFDEKFDVFFMKARAMKMAGQYNEAIQVLDAFIGNVRYKSYFVKAEFEIADVLRLAGRNTEAAKQFEYIIETYNNPIFTADSYYSLGLIHDKPILLQKENFTADPELAKKYYYLVKTKYTNSNYFSAASERFDYLTKIDLFRGSIYSDQTLLQVIENKIQDSDFVMNIENYFPTKDTSAISDLDLRAQNTSSLQENKTKTDAKKEISALKISNAELEEKIQQIQIALMDIAQIKDRDTLIFKKIKTTDMLANDYVLLADYFYFNLSDYDSAEQYYQYVMDHFKSSSMLEFALYGHARIQQKKNHPNYRSFYEYAYRVFPNGRLADIGKKILNIKENESDSVSFYFERAEEYLLQGNNYAEALQCYRQVALKDSSARKLQALYAMGFLYEKRMDNPMEAFRTYNTLMFVDPNSDYAKKVKPKVDAYAKENKIAQDSLLYWVNSSYAKIAIIKIKPDSVMREKISIKTTPTELEMDSTRSRLPQEFKPLEDDFMPLDTARVIRNKKSRDSRSPAKTKDAIKEKENDDVTKDE